jgi:predicted ATPase with chaperone activity
MFQKGDCLNPTLEQIPEGDWFCEPCLTSRASLTNIQLGEVMPSTSAAADRTIRRRVIARTNLSERVRRRVVANRAELAVRTEVDKSSNTKTVKKATKKTPIKNERTKIQKPSTRAKRISNNAEQRVSDLDRFIADFQNEWQRENSVQEKLGIYVVLFIFLVMFLMFK